MCESLCEILESENLEACYSTKSSKALRLLAENDVDLIFLDIKMPEASGIDLLRGLRARDPTIPVIMITGYPSVDNVVQSMKLGREQRVRQAAEHRGADPGDADPPREPAAEATADADQTLHRHPEPNDEEDAGRHRADRADRRAGADHRRKRDGQGAVANAIHEPSQRKERPFVKVNCAAIPESLLESELFGHERGAFTDAVAARKGKFELAHRGTIFLDEIGDMSPGHPGQDPARAPGAGVRAGRRQRGDPHGLPPDRRHQEPRRAHRRGQVPRGPLLPPVGHHASRCRRCGSAGTTCCCWRALHRPLQRGLLQAHRAASTTEVKELFLHHDWPGNVRELRNCVERAVIFCEGDRISRGRPAGPVHGVRRSAAGPAALPAGVRQLRPRRHPRCAAAQQGAEGEGRRAAEHRPAHALQPHEAAGPMTNRAPAPVLEMRDISVRYGDVVALRGRGLRPAARARSTPWWASTGRASPRW